MCGMGARQACTACRLCSSARPHAAAGLGAAASSAGHRGGCGGPSGPYACGRGAGQTGRVSAAPGGSAAARVAAAAAARASTVRPPGRRSHHPASHRTSRISASSLPALAPVHCPAIRPADQGMGCALTMCARSPALPFLILPRHCAASQVQPPAAPAQRSRPLIEPGRAGPRVSPPLNTKKVGVVRHLSRSLKSALVDSFELPAHAWIQG